MISEYKSFLRAYRSVNAHPAYYQIFWAEIRPAYKRLGINHGLQQLDIEALVKKVELLEKLIPILKQLDADVELWQERYEDVVKQLNEEIEQYFFDL